MSEYDPNKVGVVVDDRFLYTCSEVKEYFNMFSGKKLQDEIALANKSCHISVELRDGKLFYEKINHKFDPEHSFGEVITQHSARYSSLETDDIIADTDNTMHASEIELFHFTPDMLPKPIRQWTVDNCKHAEGSLNYGAVSAIIVCANVIGYRCRVKPKQNADWMVTPNLWGMLIGNPSERKSPVADQFLKPLRSLQGNYHKVFIEKYKKYKEELKYQSLAEKAKDKVLKAAYGKSDEDALQKAEAMMIPSIGDEPTEERFIINDATTEAVGQIMSKNTRTVLQYRDELSGFFSSFSKAGHEGDRAFYLEAFQGDSSYSYDRITRGSIHIEYLSIGLFGTIQPSVLEKHLLSSKGKSNDGLAQRMQLSVFSDDNYRPYADDPFDAEAREGAYTVIKKLADADFELWGATNDPFDPIPYFSFSSDIQKYFIHWYNNMKEKEREEPDVHVQGHLGKYYSLLPALALIFFLIDKADDVTDANAIEIQHFLMAEDWCGVLETHARKMYALDGLPVKVSLPDKIRTYVRDHLDLLPTSCGAISGDIRGAKAQDVHDALRVMVENDEIVLEDSIVSQWIF